MRLNRLQEMVIEKEVWSAALHGVTKSWTWLSTELTELNALIVQWLGLCSSTKSGMGLIPGWGIKILQTVWHSQEIEKIYHKRITYVKHDKYQSPQKFKKIFSFLTALSLLYIMNNSSLNFIMLMFQLMFYSITFFFQRIEM